MSERASTMSGSDIPAPVKSIEKDLMNIFYENDNILCRQPGWKDVIRVAMEGRDLLACGGAHKSSAEICVPIISRYYKKKILGSSSSSDQLMRGVASPLALILCPSMEMCKSMVDIAKTVSPLKVASAHQLHNLPKLVDILIATPGRLLRTIDRENNISLKRIKYLALDEADTMLEIGFEPHIRKIVEHIEMPPPSTRQTFIFSETNPFKIQSLASNILSHHKFLSAGRVDCSTNLIVQKVERVQYMEKRDRLISTLQDDRKTIDVNGQHGMTIVFVEATAEAVSVARWLCENGIMASANKTKVREHGLKGFCSIHVVTDCTFEGLVLPLAVTHIINYDMPKDVDHYTDRLGRLRRPGRATSFISDSDLPMAKKLVELMQEVKQEVPSWLAEFAEDYRGTYNSEGNEFGVCGRKEENLETEITGEREMQTSSENKGNLRDDVADQKQLKPSYASILKLSSCTSAARLSKPVPKPQPETQLKRQLDGQIIDVEDLLFTKSRNYLINAKHEQVMLQNLAGKFLCMYFIPLSLNCDGDDIRYSRDCLIDMQDQLDRTNKGSLEVVVVAMHGQMSLFKYLFSKMPFVAIPYIDYEARARACDKLHVSFYGTQTKVVLLHPTGKIIQPYMREMLSIFGAEGFPYTCERLMEVVRQDCQITSTGIMSWEALLGDFLISNAAYKVPTQNLMQKTVGLFLYSDDMVTQCSQLAKELKLLYEKHKQEFEIVLIHLYFCEEGFSSEQEYWKIVKSMPWLALPFKHPKCKKLWRIFQHNVMDTSSLLEKPILVIGKAIGGTLHLHGAHLLKKYGVDAYPFSWERAADLEVAKLKVLKLDSLLNSSYLLRGKERSQVSELIGKRVLFLFARDLPFGENLLLRTLKTWYGNAKGTELEFEVVFFSTCQNSVQFDEDVLNLPWLVHPFCPSNAKKSVEKFFKLYNDEEVGVVAFEHDGQIVAKELIDFDFNDSGEVTEREKIGFPYILKDLHAETLKDLENAYTWGGW